VCEHEDKSDIKTFQICHESEELRIFAPGGACFADLSRRDRLIKLDLIPVSYWFEYLDLVFFYKCRNGLFNFDIFKYVTPYIN